MTRRGFVASFCTLISILLLMSLGCTGLLHQLAKISAHKMRRYRSNVLNMPMSHHYYSQTTAESALHVSTSPRALTIGNCCAFRSSSGSTNSLAKFSQLSGWDLYGRVPYDNWLFSSWRLTDPDLLKQSFAEAVSEWRKGLGDDMLERPWLFLRHYRSMNMNLYNPAYNHCMCYEHYYCTIILYATPLRNQPGDSWVPSCSGRFCATKEYVLSTKLLLISHAGSLCWGLAGEDGHQWLHAQCEWELQTKREGGYGGSTIICFLLPRSWRGTRSTRFRSMLLCRKNLALLHNEDCLFKLYSRTKTLLSLSCVVVYIYIYTFIACERVHMVDAAG